MPNNAWTPGPWFATPCGDKHSDDNEPCFWLIDAVPTTNQETAVAELCHKPGDKAKANAHLIAAAPELYLRLEEAVDLLQRLLEDEAMEDSARSEVAVALTYYQDAMKQARREQP